MKIPDYKREQIRETLRERPWNFPLPLEPMHGWRSSPHENGHTHCTSCAHTIYVGDPCVGAYLKYVSVVFCPQCVQDNPELFAEWLAPREPAPPWAHHEGRPPCSCCPGDGGRP